MYHENSICVEYGTEAPNDSGDDRCGTENFIRVGHVSEQRLCIDAGGWFD